jgi:hypothetical protein
MSAVQRGLLRQGDVLLIPVDHVPDAATVIRAGSRLILAEGEATGHAHAVLADEAELIETRNGTSFLRVVDEGTAALVHEEHDTIPLAPGVYEVRRQREYTPTPRGTRNFRQVVD